MEKFVKFYKDRVFIVPELESNLVDVEVDCVAFKNGNFMDSRYPFTIRIYFAKSKKYIPKELEEGFGECFYSSMASSCCFPKNTSIGTFQTLKMSEYISIKEQLEKKHLTFGLFGGVGKLF